MTANKQIGWSQEAILLHGVSKQLERLAGLVAASGGGTTTIDWGAITGSITDQADLQAALGLKVDESIAAFSFYANNTAATANVVATVYRDAPLTAYAETPTWTGTAPTGGTLTYTFRTIGKKCSFYLYAVYTGAGTTVTQAVFPIPAAAPQPSPIGALGTLASEIVSVGAGNMVITSNVTVPALFRSCVLRKNAANTGWELVVTHASASSRNYFVQIEYQTV